MDDATLEKLAQRVAEIVIEKIRDDRKNDPDLKRREDAMTAYETRRK